MKILILGGTQFLGRHLCNIAIENGDQVFIFNRGISNPNLFDDEPLVTKLKGNREDDLKSLEQFEGHFDRVIDCSGNFPQHVQKSCEVLKNKTDHYIYLSSISVYSDFSSSAVNESSPTHSTEGDIISDSPQNYGARKKACEDVVLGEFGKESSTIIRPGLIVGPNDQTWRFFYWLERFSRKGEVLVSDCLNRQAQFIYVKDLAKWLLDLEVAPLYPILNAVGPMKSISFSQFFSSLKKFHNKKCELYVVPELYLIDNAVAFWSELPVCVPEGLSGIHRVETELAFKRGLTSTPLETVLKESWDWLSENFTAVSKESGLSEEREGNLIKNFRVITGR